MTMMMMMMIGLMVVLVSAVEDSMVDPLTVEAAFPVAVVVPLVGSE